MINKIKNIIHFIMYVILNPKLIGLVGKVYLPVYVQYLWLKKQKINLNTIIDIGAYHGVVSSSLLNMYPRANVYAFEPDQENCLEIQKRINGKQLTLFNLALSDKLGLSTFYKTKYAPASSLLQLGKRYRKQYAVDSSYTVKTSTLDKTLKSIKMKDLIFMKIDTQGMEQSILKGSTHILKQIAVIHIECSFVKLYEKQGLFNDIYSVLSKNGFRYMGNIPDGQFYPIFKPIDTVNAIFVNERKIKDPELLID